MTTNILYFNNVLEKASVTKESLMHPCTREEWAERMGKSPRTLYRWEGYFLEKERCKQFAFHYKRGANIKEEGGKTKIPHLLNGYQKLVFLFFAHQLEVRFKTIPDVLEWVAQEEIYQCFYKEDIEEFINSLDCEPEQPYDFSQVLEDYSIEQLTIPCTKEEWAAQMNVDVKTIYRWEKDVIQVDKCYDFGKGLLEGKSEDECRLEAKAINPVSAEYCYGEAGRKKLDAFQKVYLIVLKEIKTEYKAWNNKEVHNFLSAKIGSGYRCDNLSRSEFKRWLEQTQGGSNAA